MAADRLADAIAALKSLTPAEQLAAVTAGVSGKVSTRGVKGGVRVLWRCAIGPEQPSPVARVSRRRRRTDSDLAHELEALGDQLGLPR